MMNSKEPWECPRCNRMNAAWNPACFCFKEESIQSQNWCLSQINTPNDFGNEVEYILQAIKNKDKLY
jgi:hypothetical protein